MSASIVPIGIVIQWCVTDVLLHKRHPSFLSFILTMADHHLSLLLFKVSNEFVCSASLIAVAILWIQLLVVQYLGLGTCLFEAPLAIRCRRFYSKPLQIQQNHDNQVDHIRASRPLWSLKEARHFHLLFIIVIKMSSHSVYVELIAIPEKPKERTRRGQAIRRWKEESQTRRIDPRIACVKNHQGYNFLQGMKFLD